MWELCHPLLLKKRGLQYAVKSTVESIVECTLESIIGVHSTVFKCTVDPTVEVHKRVYCRVYNRTLSRSPLILDFHIGDPTAAHAEAPYWN